ncbi:hypothetical protein HWV62_11351 [Athelia sp. TMB]|nr:hypothetical protein HWV62_11351 [Athelia sp. TMB]
MATSLRHVWLGPGTTTCLLLPWMALESWGGEQASPEDFVDVLTKCPNLSECTSMKFFEYSSLTTPATPLHHQRLHTLAISLVSPNEFHYFFNSLVLPGLLDLRISTRRGTIWSPQDFSHFLDRSSCILRRLVLSPGTGFSAINLIDIISLVPSLTEFEFVENRYSDEAAAVNHAVLHGLIRGAAAAAPLLPNLQTLSLIGRLARDLPAALIAVLRSRTQPPYAFRALFLQLHAAEEGADAEPANVLSAADARTVQLALADTAIAVTVCEAGGTQGSAAFPPTLKMGYHARPVLRA